MMLTLAAEALFASSLQQSENPDPKRISQAVEATLLLYGAEACTALLAQESGDHPEAACRRMCWCLAAVRQASDSVAV